MGSSFVSLTVVTIKNGDINVMFYMSNEVVIVCVHPNKQAANGEQNSEMCASDVDGCFVNQEMFLLYQKLKKAAMNEEVVEV